MSGGFQIIPQHHYQLSFGDDFEQIMVSATMVQWGSLEERT
jgi:hypothetical protein